MSKQVVNDGGLLSLSPSEPFLLGRILGCPLSFFRCRISSRKAMFSVVSLLTLLSRLLTRVLSSLTSVSSAEVLDGFMVWDYVRFRWSKY